MNTNIEELVVDKETVKEMVQNTIRKHIKEEKSGEDKKYDKVYNAIADHLDIDPNDVDNQDEETKKKFYDMIDQCWDSKEDKVPDACPVDIHHLNDEE